MYSEKSVSMIELSYFSEEKELTVFPVFQVRVSSIKVGGSPSIKESPVEKKILTKKPGLITDQNKFRNDLQAIIHHQNK